MLAYFDTEGESSGGTEAINLSIEKTRRVPITRDRAAPGGEGNVVTR